jgi:hypothetical protein
MQDASGDRDAVPGDSADRAEAVVHPDAHADADGSGCQMLLGDAPGLVCFGANPAPYQTYLLPRDGGYMTGQCPTAADFANTVGEGGSAYFGCGPLQPAEIAALPDAGDVGASPCCFWVRRVYGV